MLISWKLIIYSKARRRLGAFILVVRIGVGINIELLVRAGTIVVCRIDIIDANNLLTHVRVVACWTGEIRRVVHVLCVRVFVVR